MKYWNLVKDTKSTKIKKLVSWRKHKKNNPSDGRAPIDNGSNISDKEIDYTELEDSVFYSVGDINEQCGDSEEAIINIRPRVKTSRTVSEPYTIRDGSKTTKNMKNKISSINSLLPNSRIYSSRSSSKGSTSSYHSEPPMLLIEDVDLKDSFQYGKSDAYDNYAHLDARKVLSVGKHMPHEKPKFYSPCVRRRLESSPGVLQQQSQYRKSKGSGDNTKCVNGYLSAETQRDSLRRSKSVDEILITRGRNSSSYQKFSKTSSSTSFVGKFAQYIEVNGVEYKVPSNVPKHPPPDIIPPPPLPMKTKHSQQNNNSSPTNKAGTPTSTQFTLLKPFQCPRTCEPHLDHSSTAYEELSFLKDITYTDDTEYLNPQEYADVDKYLNENKYLPEAEYLNEPIRLVRPKVNNEERQYGDINGTLNHHYDNVHGRYHRLDDFNLNDSTDYAVPSNIIETDLVKGNNLQSEVTYATVKHTCNHNNCGQTGNYLINEDPELCCIERMLTFPQLRNTPTPTKYESVRPLQDILRKLSDCSKSDSFDSSPRSIQNGLRCKSEFEKSVSSDSSPRPIGNELRCKNDFERFGSPDSSPRSIQNGSIYKSDFYKSGSSDSSDSVCLNVSTRRPSKKKPSTSIRYEKIWRTSDYRKHQYNQPNPIYSNIKMTTKQSSDGTTEHAYANQSVAIFDL